jgi:hypothetical protein
MQNRNKLEIKLARFCYSNARLSLCLTTFKIRDIPFPTHVGHYIELLFKKYNLCVKKQQHIVNIFYMEIVLITLIERNTKRFVQNWHLPKSTSTEWS